MKNHFPFTDYDFYAYLASGGILLAVLDWVYNGGGYLSLADWNFGQIAATVAASYVAGHIVAMLAQTTLETSLIGSLFAKPMDIQLGFKKPHLLERALGKAVGRYYEPMNDIDCRSTISQASTRLSCDSSEFSNGESIFQLSFKDSFSDEKLRHRIDGFRNQYGFCRNIAFVALVSSIVFAVSAWRENGNLELVLALVSMFVFVAMFIRYMKFLATFQAEVIRSLKN